LIAVVSRHRQLRVELEYCRERVRYAQQQVDNYARTADLSTDLATKTLRKLADDLKRALDDTRSLQKQLDDLMD
jgi:hypothetical protein